MDKIIEQLKEHFANTPQEVLEQEWKEYIKYNEIGPTIDEYIQEVERQKMREKIKYMTDDEVMRYLILTKE